MVRVAIDSNYAGLIGTNSGLHLFDISNPATPTLLDNYPLIGSSRGLALGGGNAYVANQDTGLWALRYEEQAQAADWKRYQ